MTVSAKDLRVAPISSKDARRLTVALHYSKRWVPNSQLHFGVFLGDRCGGVMSFGPPMDKAKSVGLVRDTPWNGMLELNRLAFGDWLPRNGESRALSVALRLIRKNYPQVQWVLSFSDATQCGDGTIYRASGFVLTAIKPTDSIIEFPDGSKFTRQTLTNPSSPIRAKLAARYGVRTDTPEAGGATHEWLTGPAGARVLPGFMLRYVFFLDPTARERLTVPILPFSDIAKAGATMARGVAGAVGSQDTRAPE